jgi:hypothetical protein
MSARRHHKQQVFFRMSINCAERVLAGGIYEEECQ